VDWILNVEWPMVFDRRMGSVPFVIMDVVTYCIYFVQGRVQYNVLEYEYSSTGLEYSSILLFLVNLVIIAVQLAVPCFLTDCESRVTYRTYLLVHSQGYYCPSISTR
jgi:hypothetical protein